MRLAVLAVPLAAGLGAAVVGGVLWGWAVKSTGYEFGIEASAVGFIVGMTVRTAARDRRGTPLQIVAVGAALVGVLIGKYLSYAWLLQVVGPYGLDVQVPAFSREMLGYFREDLRAIFSVFDLLWVALAVGAAWGLLAPRRPVERPAADRPPLAP